MGTKAEVDLVTTADETAIGQAGAALSGLVKGVRDFLLDAKALEMGAEATRQAAQSLRMPTTADEDADLQRFIKRANEGKKAIEAHWSICATVWALHRRLTARREVGVKALDEAATIGNKLHNGYTAAAELAARLEQDRLRAEAEASAQRVRAAELERLEELALVAEQGQEGLSDREAAFVGAIVAGATDWAEAARVAGYKDPGAQGARLMRTEKIAVAIKAQHEALELRRQATAVQAQPLTVNVVAVLPNVVKAAGTQERTTWAAEIYDVEKWRIGVLTGAIPSDTMMPNMPVLNSHARSLRHLIDKWPGCRAVATSKVI